MAILHHPIAARAHLGGNESTVETDRMRISGKKISSAKSTNGTYTVHSLESDAHKVREYADSNGTIFAVTWNGFNHPNLDQLLGAHAQEYQTAFKKYQDDSKKNQTRKRHHHIQGKNITVEKTGHMRNFTGRAYLPSLIPSGVKLDEIK